MLKCLKMYLRVSRYTPHRKIRVALFYEDAPRGIQNRFPAIGTFSRTRFPTFLLRFGGDGLEMTQFLCFAILTRHLF